MELPAAWSDVVLAQLENLFETMFRYFAIAPFYSLRPIAQRRLRYYRYS